jgi:DHA3 family macrolide efflux protein-like MFS transporter
MSTAAATPPTALSMRDVLKLPGFRRLWMAQLVSIFGDFLAVFGVMSLITFRWHGTPLQVTNMMIAFMVPLAIIGPLSGVFVDRWNVKVTMIASDLIRAALILLLVFVTRLDQIYVIFFAVSTVSSFFGPSQSVTIRSIVPMNGLMAANAMMSQAFYTVRIFSPAAAGLLVAWLGERSCFYLDTASFVFSAAMLSTLVIVRTITPQQQEKKGVKSLLSDFGAGGRFILTHPEISFVMIAMMTAMFVLSCFSPLISVYVRDTLHAGPRSFGFISAMVGVGLIAGTQAINALAKGRSHRHVALTGLLGLGVSTAILAASRFGAVAGLSMFCMGFAIACIIVPAQTLMQKETPPQMLGRVSSSFMSLFSVSQVLGLVLSGILADAIGVRSLFAACGVVLAVLTAAGYVWIRGLGSEDRVVAAAG